MLRFGVTASEDGQTRYQFVVTVEIAIKDAGFCERDEAVICLKK